MPTLTYACLNCRTWVRRVKIHQASYIVGAYSGMPCPSCRANLRYVGHNMELPRKQNVAAWKDVETKLLESLAAGVRHDPPKLPPANAKKKPTRSPTRIIPKQIPPKPNKIKIIVQTKDGVTTAKVVKIARPATSAKAAKKPKPGK